MKKIIKIIIFSQNVSTELFNSCPNLINLKLTGNAISVFPVIHSLHELHLGYNEIEIVPDNIDEMIHLKMLDLEGNRLSSLPVTLSNLTRFFFLSALSQPPSFSLSLTFQFKKCISWRKQYFRRCRVSWHLSGLSLCNIKTN